MSKSLLLPKLFLFAVLLAAISPARVTFLVDSWAGFFPMLFLFGGLAFGVWGWGRFFALRLGYGLFSEAALFSSLVAVLAGFLWGHLGFLTEAGRVTALAFLIVGVFLNNQPISLPRFSWISGLLGFLILFRFFNAFLPSAHGDPFIYHLLGPRLWVAGEAVKQNPDLPNALLASAWEYFYLWPQLLFARSGEIHSLVMAQIFSQWIHLFWGWLGIPLVADAIFFRAGGRTEARFLVFLSLLFVSSLQWTAGLAKNDCGIAFWALGAFYFWWNGLSAEKRFAWKDFLFAGVFGGLAVAGKLNAAIFLAPAFSLSFLFSLRQENSVRNFIGLVITAATTAVAAGVFFFRNFRLTGNPFFPMFQERFPSPWVSQSWADNFSSMHPSESHFQVSAFLERLTALPKESPLMLCWLLLPGFWFFPQGRVFLRKNMMVLVIAAATLVFFSLAFGGNIEMRHLGAGLILLAAMGALILNQALELSPNARVKRFGPLIAMIVVLACSHIPLHLLAKAFRIHPGVPFLNTHTAGDSKAWLRDKTGANELIVVMADNEMYYLSSLHVTVLTERPDIDRATYGVQDFRAFMHGLCDTSHGSYLLDARANIGVSKRFPGIDLSSALLFRGAASAVYDLGKMEKLAYKDASACASAAK
ncbi:MAG: hypothetical protein ACXWQO_04580 [Bdellovibrionota bacterium]